MHSVSANVNMICRLINYNNRIGRFAKSTASVVAAVNALVPPSTPTSDPHEYFMQFMRSMQYIVYIVFCCSVLFVSSAKLCWSHSAATARTSWRRICLHNNAIFIPINTSFCRVGHGTQKKEGHIKGGGGLMAVL